MKKKKIYSLLLTIMLVFSSFSVAYADEKNESTIDVMDEENSVDNTQIHETTDEDETKNEANNVVSTQEVIQDKITDAEIEAYADNVVLSVEKPADFVFIIDSTGSMSGYISSVKENLTAFMKYLQEKNVDIQISVVDYKDITCDGLESTVVHRFDGNEWTKDVNKVIDEFNNINVDGGGDTPETPTDAFEKIINFSTWRDNAQRFVFLLTDADYKSSSDDANIKDMDEYINIFRRNNIRTTVVGLPTYQSDYEKLYNLTGGKFIDITSSDYYKIMIEIADWVFDSMQDSDGDGLPDEWETNGVDIDGDGVIDLHLEQMGADPNVPDVFVEIDWMYQPKIEGSFLGIKYEKQKEINLKPSAEALKMVYEQFKAHGINLHLDAGSDSIDYVTGKQWGELSGANSIEYVDMLNLGSNYENWNQYAINNFSHARWNVFRYAMFINKFDEQGHSGLAENLPGQFFLIADVDGWISGNSTSLAGTFMHELGHTLGLHHGGDEDVNNKVNYLSIMNYLFQTTGLVGTNEINYSDYELPAIDEENLDENVGIDPEGLTAGKSIGTKWKYNKKMLFWTKVKDGSDTSIAKKALDYNRNGKLETGLNIDLNGDEETKYAKSINDWQYLTYAGGLIGGQGAETESLISKNLDVENSLNELTYEEAVENGVLGNPGSCEIEKIGPAKVYTNVKNEKLAVKINNLSTEKVAPTVRVKSDILENPYEEQVEIEGNTDKINSVKLEIPVKESLKEGDYSVECEVEFENGTVERKNETITVCKANTVEISVGEKLNLSTDDNNSSLSYKWESSNDCTDINESGELVGCHAGSAVITGTNSEDDQIKFIANVSKNNAGKDDSDNKDKINPDNAEKGNSDNINKVNSESNPKKESTTNSKNVKTDTNVKTGDQNHFIIYIGAMLVSILIISGMIFSRKKKQ